MKLVLPTARLERPSLAVASYEVNDGTTGLARGNGNGIPENGETIELLAFVRNSGPGPAAATTLSLVSVDRGVEVVQRDVSLGTILPNQTARGNLAFTIPRTYTGTSLNLTLQAKDGRGESVGAASRQITIPLTARAPVLAATPRILSGGREIKELTNGQTVEVEVTPRNTGTLDADQVMVRLSARESGLVFRQDRELIGTLRAGTVGRPVIFELNIPRTFVNDRLALNVELSQREFSSQTERLDIPVVVRRPVLVSSFTVAGRLGGRAIEQNETVDLEVRVVNTGDLSAQNVQASIDVKVPGVEVQGSKRVDIGTIPRSGQSFARFQLQVRRSVPTGELPISMVVSQSDFPSLADILRLEVRLEKAIEVQVRPGTPVSPPAVSRAQPPIIALVAPTDGQFVQTEQVELRGTVVDEKGIDRVRVTVNGKPVPEETIRRGLRRIPGSTRDQIDLSLSVPVEKGRNAIEITAYNLANEQERLTRVITRLEGRALAGGKAPILVPHADVDRYILNFNPIQPDRRRWAVIIGIEQYRRAPSVTFAARDAIAMREYAIKLLGVPLDQVFYLADDQATRSEIQVILEDRLQQRVQPGDRVYVYFAGHGVPEVRDGTPYLLPADGDPQSLRLSAYPVREFYSALGKLKAERVVVFLDACFSGLSARQEPAEMLLAGIRPIGWTVEDPVLLSPNLISFAAAEKDQVSNAYKEQAHGLFTYYLLKGLGGAADKNSDGNVLLSELADYARDQVSRTSRQNYGQALYQMPVVRPDIDPSRDMILKAK